jgi:hypothetical protein
MDKAFDDLCYYILTGMEFPDALWKASTKNNVSYEALQSLYDAL